MEILNIQLGQYKISCCCITVQCISATVQKKSVYTNFKKDSSTRINRVYLEKLLASLEKCMEQISENHEQILIFPDRADTYFKGKIIKNDMDK
jgi:hypothetical protein